MSELIDRIKNHAVFDELRAFGKAIDTALAREHADPPAVIDGLERLRAVLTYTGKRLSAIDPAVSDPRPLTSIQNALAKARTELDAYTTDGNVAHIATANTHADDVIGVLAAVLTVQVSEDLTALNEAAGSYRNTLETNIRTARDLIARLTAEANSANAKFQDLTNDVATEKQKLAQVLTEQQTAFATAQADRQEKAGTASAEYLKQFTESQASRQNEYGTLVAEHKKLIAEQEAATKAQLTEATRASGENLEKLRGEYEKAAKGVLDEIDTHKKKVERLVGVIGNLGVTSGYKTAADRALVSLYVWQFLTVGALGLLIYVAFLIVSQVPDKDPTIFYQGMSGRIFLSVTVGIFAAYAARQASNFWQIERQNRKLALELEALGPYIAPLPEPEQHKFRLQVGDRSFGVADGSLEKLAEKAPVSSLDMIKELRALITEVVKGR